MDYETALVFRMALRMRREYLLEAWREAHRIESDTAFWAAQIMKQNDAAIAAGFGEEVH